MKKIMYPDIRGEMARHGETNNDLGKLLGVTSGSISRRLSGEIEWSISEIELLCKHYNKNYYELFTKEGE